jgi:hypothetical protein
MREQPARPTASTTLPTREPAHFFIEMATLFAGRPNAALRAIPRQAPQAYCRP